MMRSERQRDHVCVCSVGCLGHPHTTGRSFHGAVYDWLPRMTIQSFHARDALLAFPCFTERPAVEEGETSEIRPQVHVCP